MRHFSLELPRWHIILSALKSHHIIFKVFTEYINYNSLFLTIIKKMYETKDHGFHDIQELMSRHLTNSTSDENILIRWIAHQLAEGSKNKAHVDTCEITEKYQQ